jgi:hypothetical protein
MTANRFPFVYRLIKHRRAADARKVPGPLGNLRRCQPFGAVFAGYAAQSLQTAPLFPPHRADNFVHQFYFFTVLP